MTRWPTRFVWLVVVLVSGCRGPREAPRPARVALCPEVAELPAQVVLGFADLHAHPAIGVAFDQSQLVWGDSRSAAPPDATLLPAPIPCPVETHVATSGGSLERTAHTLILPLINQQSYFPHPLIAAPANQVEAGGWPNGRDVLHQQMHVSSIRRAYEGGLRLMFASVTDNQVLAGLVGGAHFVDAFQPSRDYELESARRQLDAIQTIAAEQADWMAIARDPEEARSIIRGGRLALVLSLEMDGLTLHDMESLIDEYGVGHVIAVHLVDNDVGGTAAFSPIFNAATALESSMFGRGTLRYIEVRHSPDHRRRLERPLRLAPMPDVNLLFDPQPVGFTWYEALGYECTSWCVGPPRSDWVTHRWSGHINEYGLSPHGEDVIRALMRRGVIVDVSHMGYRAVEATLQLAEANDPPYPLIASHGGVTAPDSAADNERSLAFDQARRIARLGGVMGLGTEGSYQTRPILVARGGPALAIPLRAGTISAGCVSEGGEEGCLRGRNRPDSFEPCESIERRTLSVWVEGSLVTPAGMAAMLMVDLSDPSGVETTRPGPGARLMRPLVCTTPTLCTAEVTFAERWPAPPSADTSACGADAEPEALSFALQDIETITVAWVRADGTEDACRAGRDDLRGALQRYQVRFGDSVLAAESHPTAITTIDESHGAYVLYSRNDHAPSTADFTPASIVRVAIVTSPGAPELPGAGTTRFGTEVCGRLRVRAAGGACSSVGGPEPTERGCGTTWTSLNFRGAWPAGTRFDGFLRPHGPGEPCGLDLRVLGWEGADSQWSLDHVRLEEISDPAREWTREYVSTLRDVFDGEAGRIALGSDMNGLQVQMPITASDPSRDGFEVWGCRGIGRLPPLRVAGGTDPVALSRQGLGTYGLLADLVALSGEVGPPCGADTDFARRSLFLSAEATLRLWENVRAISSGEPPHAHDPLPTMSGECVVEAAPRYCTTEGAL